MLLTALKETSVQQKQGTVLTKENWTVGLGGNIDIHESSYSAKAGGFLKSPSKTGLAHKRDTLVLQKFLAS